MSQLLLWFVLGRSVAQAPTTQGGIVQQTIRSDADGNTTADQRAFAPGTATVRTIQAGGRVSESSRGPNARILIEVRERPLFDRFHPGSPAEAMRQDAQLAQDLALLDDRLQVATPSTITRQYHTLFSGVAATVDAKAVEEIRQLPNVAAVYMDVEVHAEAEGGARKIATRPVRSTATQTGAGIRVAVVDTGIDYTHPDLGGCLGPACRVTGGHDFVNGDDDPRDDNGHGTHVAGIIAANGAMTGVAPGATLRAYKVLDQWGYGASSNVIAGIEQAVLDGAQVVNLSLGGQGDPSDPLSQAVDNATAAGVLSVVAAGNSGPSYNTVGSPGTARTALTVGASDGDAVAYFSSRGFVVDGDRLVMKPDVVAPGVNIRSTVPATGINGSPDRYATLSGTSMASPYVAGTAALLLEWNATLTPAELKERLVSSARSLSLDPFTQGAGAVDVDAALSAPVLASATDVSFGAIETTSGTITREETISLRNTSAAAQTLTLTSDATLAAGATLQIIPSSVVLQAGESASVLLRLQADAAVVPEPADDSMAFSTRVAVSNGTQSIHVPAYFFKAVRLDLTFDERPWLVHLVTPSNAVKTFYLTGTSATTLVKRGMYDVIVPFSGVFNAPLAIAVREQQDFQSHTTLHITRAEATRALTVRTVDDAGQPLVDPDAAADLVLGVPTPNTTLPNSTFEFIGGRDYLLTNLSSRFTVGFTGRVLDRADHRFFISNWSARGIASDVTLPKSGVPFRRLAQTAALAADEPVARFAVQVGFAMKTSWGGLGSLGGSLLTTADVSRTLYFQNNFAPELPLLPLQQTFFAIPTATNDFDYVREIGGAYLNFRDVSNIAVDRYPFFTLFDASRTPDTVLGSAVQRWDLDVAPNYLPLDFLGATPPLIRTNEAMWLTQTLNGIKSVAHAEPSFTLYRQGVLVGTFPLSNLYLFGVTSPAGSHEIRSSSDYRIGGVAGSTRVSISFDTSKSDGVPPHLSQFRIEQNGLRTPTPFYPSSKPAPMVRFSVPAQLTGETSTLEWRQNGTTDWTSLPLTQTSSRPSFEAAVPHEGAIDLRITATDAAGNRFQEEWTPAFIASAPAPPVTPASFTATRSGASSIALSWSPAASVAGIAGYRIERMPGGQTFNISGEGTTYTDSNALASGSAYFYRVSAVDTENALSAPTPYDVATLVDFADDPAVAGATLIRGAHLADLRRGIDAVRQAGGLPKFWTSYNPQTGTVKASQFLELRDRLNEARTAMQLPGVSFSDPVAPGAPVRARTLKELRDGVK